MLLRKHGSWTREVQPPTTDNSQTLNLFITIIKLKINEACVYTSVIAVHCRKFIIQF